MGNLAGKTLFITGASRGIGLAIALRAARDGANIVIAAKSGVANPKLPGTIHTAAAAVETGLAEGTPVIVPCPQEKGFKLQPEDLERAITPRTKWLIMTTRSASPRTGPTSSPAIG